MANPEELAKLHCLQSLFGPATGNDPYLAQQIKHAIEFSLTGSSEVAAPLEKFAQAALRLLQEQEPLTSSCGLYCINFNNLSYDPLWIRGELIGALKHLAGYETKLLLITGLRNALCPSGKYWTRRVRERYEDAMNYIDQLALNWSTPNSTLNIVYV